MEQQIQYHRAFVPAPRHPLHKLIRTRVPHPLVFVGAVLDFVSGSTDFSLCSFEFCRLSHHFLSKPQPLQPPRTTQRRRRAKIWPSPARAGPRYLSNQSTVGATQTGARRSIVQIQQNAPNENFYPGNPLPSPIHPTDFHPRRPLAEKFLR